MKWPWSHQSEPATVPSLVERQSPDVQAALRREAIEQCNQVRTRLEYMGVEVASLKLQEEDEACH